MQNSDQMFFNIRRISPLTNKLLNHGFSNHMPKTTHACPTPADAGNTRAPNEYIEVLPQKIYLHLIGNVNSR